MLMFDQIIISIENPYYIKDNRSTFVILNNLGQNRIQQAFQKIYNRKVSDGLAFPIQYYPIAYIM